MNLESYITLELSAAWETQHNTAKSSLELHHEYVNGAIAEIFTHHKPTQQLSDLINAFPKSKPWASGIRQLCGFGLGHVDLIRTRIRQFAKMEVVGEANKELHRRQSATFIEPFRQMRATLLSLHQARVNSAERLFYEVDKNAKINLLLKIAFVAGAILLAISKAPVIVVVAALFAAILIKRSWDGRVDTQLAAIALNYYSPPEPYPEVPVPFTMP